MSERKLASIQKVLAITEIPGADSIEQVTVLGWSLIAKKGEFQVGDKCVFFEIDSILPSDAPWAAFLAPKKFKVNTMKLTKLGVVSQGLALPLSILPMRTVSMVLNSEDAPYHEGEDVTALLGVTKYENPDDFSLNGSKGLAGLPFPSGIPQTDEERIQNAPWFTDLIKGLDVYITQKLDGCSATYFILRDEFRVASRRQERMEDDSVWWDVARELKIEEGLRKMSGFEGLVIQGEITGPGIQSNRLGLKKHAFNIFNAYNIFTGEYYGLAGLMWLSAETGLDLVPILAVTAGFNHDAEWLENYADLGQYDNGSPAEGIVVRPLAAKQHPLLGQVSIKVISKPFLIKYGG